MTNRDYWINALNHRYSDRVPMDLWIAKEPKQALLEHFATTNFTDVESALGLTPIRVLSVNWRDPAWEDRTDLQTLQGNSPFSGGRFLLHDERTFENQWGVIMRVGSSGRHDEWLRGPLSDSAVPDANLVTTPPVEQLHYSPDLAAEVAALKEHGEYTCIKMSLPFKSAWYLRGLENMLADYYLNPRFVAEIYDRLVERELPRLRIAIEAGVDLIKITGDVAMQDRMIMGPDLWREFDKQALKKLLAACRAVNPNVAFFVHSDGNLSPIMGDLVDDLGFDMVNPLQPECMDLDWVKREYGDRMVMYGCVSLQRTLPFGTPREVRTAVREIIDRYGANGGLAIAPANNIDLDTPTENIIALCETARDYFPF